MLIDPLTKEKFIPKRKNQKFASSLNRMRYHNDRHYEKRLLKAFADKALSRNFDILHELMSDKKPKIVHSQLLLGMGYDFTYFTHYHSLEGNYQYCVYKYVLIPLENENYKIISI